MQNAKKTILLAVMFSAVAIGLCLAKPLRRTARQKSIKALQLLDKFAETQDRLQSFIIKSEDSTEYVAHIKGKRQKKKYNVAIEFRLDENRYKRCEYMWGNINAISPDVSKDNPLYRSDLGDANSNIWYGRADKENDLGRVTLDKKYKSDRRKTEISRAYWGHEVMGFFYGDDERFDSVLRQADTISVRDKMHSIGGFDCYVIDAETKRGKYTIWLDPAHGYNIAKAVVNRGESDLFYDYGPLKKRDKIFTCVRNIRFKKIDDVWVPMEMDLKLINIRPLMNFDYKEKKHHKRTEVILNPDHDALGSFLPDEIPNGAKVRVVDEAIGLHKIRYIWQDGEVVDANGRKVDFEKLNTKTTETKNAKPK